MRKNEKTRENKRKQEIVKSKLKFSKKGVDTLFPLWYYILAEFFNYNFGGKQHVNLYGKTR